MSANWALKKADTGGICVVTDTKSVLSNYVSTQPSITYRKSWSLKDIFVSSHFCEIPVQTLAVSTVGSVIHVPTWMSNP